MRVIQGLSKQTIKFIKSLQYKKYRLQEQAFVLEGARSILELVASDYEVFLVAGTAAFIAENRLLLQQRAGAVMQVSPAVLASLGEFQSNTAALAVAKIPVLQPIPDRSVTRGLLLEDIRDPGNLGTILRIADWYGISSVTCSVGTVDPYNPKVLQASMGSFLRVPVVYTVLPAYLHTVSLPVVGACSTGENLHHTRLPCPGWVVIGNEARGISAGLAPYIQRRIGIPRYGGAESLNAAVATAVVCDHWRRL